MNKKTIMSGLQTAALGAVFLALFTIGGAHAAIDGITGQTTFNLAAKTAYISTPDSSSLLIWGFSDEDGLGVAQYPGPTLIVNQGEIITITLSNDLTVAAGSTPNVSIVFPGQQVDVVPTDPGVQGSLTGEAVPAGTVSYQFTATNPGTYTYYSGTDSSLQVEMGLFGAIIVRPTLGADHAYNHSDTQFDREYLFLLSEMDARIHEEVGFYGPDALSATDFLSNYFSVLWFINGRAAPDTMSEPGLALLPHQPYNSLPKMHPGERLLMRVVGGGQKMHPFHHHGNHARVIAHDGRLLESGPGLGPDLSHEVFTIPSHPGTTTDAIFQWTGKGLGWDIYGGTDTNTTHTCNGKLVGQPQDVGAPEFDPVTHEYCADHGKVFPTVLPQQPDLTFGGFYSGNPYLGGGGDLPPGEGGLNPNGGFTYMWHSHDEKELVNYDIFPGGMLTMLFIEPPGATIP